MNRRSFLTFLGLAPVAAPAAAMAASAPAIDYADLAKNIELWIGDAGVSVIDLRADGSRILTFDGQTLAVPSVRTVAITHEARARCSADTALAARIDGVVARSNTLMASLP